MSRRDLRPVPVIRGCGRVTNHVFLPLGNSGWGPMDNCVFHFHLERDADPVPRTSEYSWSLDGDGQPLDDTPFIEAHRGRLARPLSPCQPLGWRVAVHRTSSGSGRRPRLHPDRARRQP